MLAAEIEPTGACTVMPGTPPPFTVTAFPPPPPSAAVQDENSV